MAVSFLKKGKKAIAAINKADAEQQAAKDEAANRVYRFRLPEEGEGSITFLDGDLDADGLLQINMYWEHNVMLNGSWNHYFVCVGETEPCPICEGGMKPALVAAFSVIDHSEWTDKQGNEHKDERRLFVAKRQTIKQLQKIATKRDGLTGCTFEVTRTGDKAAAVGNMFEFVDKVSLLKIKKMYGDEAQVIDYEEAIKYKEGKELRKLGFGTVPTGAEDYDDEDYAPAPKKKPAPKPKAPVKKYQEPDEEDEEEYTPPPKKKPVPKAKPKPKPKYEEEDEDYDDDM